MDDPPRSDPYRGCEKDCCHDLARGVLTDELTEKDGPYPGTADLDGGAAFVLAALRVRETAGELASLER